MTMLSTKRFRQFRYLFVIAGESNSGGTAPNSALTPDQMLPQKHCQIWNNGTSKFEPLTIGTNNLISHTVLPDNATHGLERGLAQEVLTSFQWDEACILKAGHGGSLVSQWLSSSPTGYWQTLQTRYLAAIVDLKARGFEPVPIFVWMNGINDAVSNTVPSDFRAKTEQVLTQIRQLTGQLTQIYFPKIMETNAQYIAINDQIQAMTLADPYLFSIDTKGFPLMDSYHYTANGYVCIARAIVDSISKNISTAVVPNFTRAREMRNPVICLYREPSMSIPSSVRTVIPMTGKTVDTDTMFDPTLGAIVIPMGCDGVYLITGAVTVSPCLMLRVQILVNDVMVAQSPIADFTVNVQYSGEVNRRIRLKVGDVVKLSCFQASQAAASTPTWIQPEFRSMLEMNRICL